MYAQASNEELYGPILKWKILAKICIWFIVKRYIIVRGCGNLRKQIKAVTSKM